MKLTIEIYLPAPRTADGYAFYLDGKAMSVIELLQAGYRLNAEDKAEILEAAKVGKDCWIQKHIINAVEDLQYINLRKMIDKQIDLAEEDREGLVQLLCKGCRTPKWNRIRSIIYYDMLRLPSLERLERLVFDTVNKRWTFTAGQSYTDEVAYIRDHVVYSK